MNITRNPVSPSFLGGFRLFGSGSFNPVLTAIFLLTMTIAGPVFQCQGAAASEKASGDSVIVYVSPVGNDSWSGFVSRPNTLHSDGPLRTIQAALTRIGELSEKGTRPNTRYEVLIRQGVYYLPNGATVHFESKRGSSLIIRNYPGELVTITGGVKLRHFVPLSGLSVKSRIKPEFAKDVYACNLKEAGIDNYGKITERGHPPLQVFFDDTLMTLARYPNKGWLIIAGVPQSGAVLYNLGMERERRYDGVPVGRNFGKIEFSGDRPAGWSRNDDIFVHGYWTWDWFDSFKRVDSINLSDHTLSLSPAADPYGYTKGQRYYFLNVPEELDTLGEWYLDKKSGYLYFWPPENISEGKTVVSVTDSPLLTLPHCSRVSISGIYFDISRGDGVVIDGGTGNAVEGCVMRNLGGNAVLVNGGHENGVKGSVISDIGSDAVVIIGGNRNTLTAGRNYAMDNDVEHFGTWIQNVHGIICSGVGDVVSHNEIFDAPFEGLYITGNNQLVAFNNFHDLCKESGDAGAMHTGRDWTWRGNVIKYNYFHDLKGPGLHGVMGVYLDDWSSGFTVYGNVFDHADHAVFIGGGRDNLVENNVFIGCSPSVSIDGRGFSWGSYYFGGQDGAQLFDEMVAMKYARNPYKEAYPLLATLAEGDPAAPAGNVIANNISCDGRWLDVHDYGTFKMSIIHDKGNVIADPMLLRRRKGNQIGWDPYYLNLETDSGYVILGHDSKRARQELAGNIFVSDSDLAKISNGRLEVSNTALRCGFKPIPFQQIGTYDTPSRKLAEWILTTAERFREENY